MRSYLDDSDLHEAVAKLDTIVKILHADALVLAMRAIIFHIEKHAGNAERRDAGNAQIFAVGGARGHGGHHLHAGHIVDSVRSRARGSVQATRAEGGTATIGINFPSAVFSGTNVILTRRSATTRSSVLSDLLGILAGENTAVHDGASGLRQGVGGVPTREHCGHTSGAQQSVVIEVGRQMLNRRGIGRLLGGSAEIRSRWAGGEIGGLQQNSAA